MQKPLVVIGAGGFGREVAWLVQEINESLKEPEWNLLGFVDDGAIGTEEGYSVLGRMDWLRQQHEGLNVVCAIGDPRVRKMVVESLKELSINYATLIHPTVKKSSFVTIGEGTVICCDSILTTNISVGRHCLLNLGTRVGHDSILKDYCSLMPGVNIAGEVEVGEGCYFGLNACVINRTKVGEWTVVGAGATVVSDLPEKCVAVGVPAKPIKRLP